MTRAAFAVLLLAGVLAAPVAHAQYKVSEVMDKGGRIMNAQELRAELGGAKVSGVNEFGHTFEIELKTDSKIAGMVYTPRGPSGMTGSWKVNAKNQICTDITLTANGATLNRCVWYWKAGNDYYSTNSQTDAEAANDMVDCMISGGTDCKRNIALGKRTVSR